MSSEAFDAARVEIETYLEARLAPLRELSSEVARVVGEAGMPSSAEDLAHLTPILRERLDADPVMIGYGFAAADGAIRDHRRFLLWLQRRAGVIRPLNLNLVDGDPELYDYLDTDWFLNAERDMAPTVYGPYVDYAGADFLVLTVVVPVVVDGQFIGVTGADMDPGLIEGAVVSIMRSLPGDAVIVAADRSVMASGSPRWMPGERMAVHPSTEPAKWCDLAALRAWAGWTLALAPRSD